jgi:hypothetical protein
MRSDEADDAVQQLLGACVVSGHSRIRRGGALGGKRRGVNKAAVQVQCDACRAAVPCSRQCGRRRVCVLWVRG